MKIPNQVKIGAHIYKIKIVNENSDLELENNGRVDKVKGLITLDGTLMPTELSGTFLHEILHVINNELDHALLDSLSQQLLQVLEDNKLLK